MIEFITDKQLIKPSDISSFLYSIDDDFIPKLSERLCIDNWVSKILLKAELICAKTDNKTVGLIVFYANDNNSHTAYISLLGVSSTFRKQGIGTDLLVRSFKKMKEKGMIIVGIHTNKENALELYKKTGFKLISQTSTDNTSLIRYYLEQEL